MSLPSPLYKVELIEQDGHHYYSVNGSDKWLPGVTEALGYISKPALVPWAARETALYIGNFLKKLVDSPERNWFLNKIDIDLLVKRAKKQPRFIKERAAQIGTQTHFDFDVIIKMDLSLKKIAEERGFVITNTTEDENPALYQASFNHWMKTEELKIVAGDTKIASTSFGYGGSIDVILQDKEGRFVVGDFKTGNSLYNSHAYQVAAYAQAMQEMYDLDYFPKGIVIRFEKDKPQYHRWEIENTQISLEGFLHAKAIYKIEHMNHFSKKEIIKKPKEKSNETTANKN